MMWRSCNLTSPPGDRFGWAPWLNCQSVILYGRLGIRIKHREPDSGRTSAGLPDLITTFKVRVTR